MVQKLNEAVDLIGTGLELLAISAENCGPCKWQEPQMLALINKYEKASGQYIMYESIGKASEVLPTISFIKKVEKEFRGFPFIALFKDGQLVEHQVGYNPKNLESFFQKAVGISVTTVSDEEE